MNIAKYIDHTNIKEDAAEKDIKKSCKECIKYKFRGLCVRSSWTKTVKEELEGEGVKVVTLIDPPIGLSSHKERIEMVEKAKKDGTDEVDIVMNLVDLKYEKYGKVLKDLKEICKIAPTKVIIGSGYLTDQEIGTASKIVKKAGAICVKTATEKDPLGNSELEEKAKHIKIMKKSAPGLLVKAAGAIRTFNDAKKMIKSGADIIGTSSGVEIVEQSKKK
ncbi:MAG: deoxyribose-phosphate aldolase [Candidatus Pacebacteria bacterium]|nr:deoxyribose-phosphate aldolase [Candidatus Paceibacterota bacterium]